MTDAREFTRRLSDLLRRERDAMAEFLVALAEFDARKLWRDLGHASLFSFLHRDLALSTGAAYYRKTAAELVQRFPEVIEPLQDGRLCITSVVALARVMTPENRRDVLPRFFHLSKREAVAEAVALKPVEAAPQRDVVTRVAADRATEPAATEPGGGGTGAAPSRVPLEQTASFRGLAAQPDAFHLVESPSCQLASTGETNPCCAVASPPRDGANPIDAARSRLHVTVSKQFLDKLDAARDALSHARPGAGLEEILEAGLDLVIDRYRKRNGLVEKPRANGPARPEYVSAQVRRQAWQRAGGRCEWPLDGGGVCGSTHRLEFDHVIPRALGGPSTLANIRLLCRVHNQLHAERTYGSVYMERVRGERGRAAAHATLDIPVAKEPAAAWRLTPSGVARSSRGSGVGPVRPSC